MLRLRAVAIALAITLSSSGTAQDPERPQSRPGGPPPGSPPRLPEGMTNEQMWPPPTREDWARPVLIEFQRTWADAVAVAQETGKPILICINMDGEIASEHYAGIKYRDPEYAKLFAPYVCVVASVYRHSSRDYDEDGHRILCPRLGSVTCGEHIAIEPVLYEKYMDGQRISPRHIMVELDGNETYDVFYAWDTASVFTTIRDGIANRPASAPPVVRGDRTIIERVQSRHIADRTAVEKAYRDGDEELRRRLLEAALAHPDAAPVDLLRLGVFGFDVDLAGIARDALAKVDEPHAVDLIGEALAVPMVDAQRENLVSALERISAKSPRARLLAKVHRGLDVASNRVDVNGWANAMQGGGAYAPPPDRAELENRIAARPSADPDAALELAEASLALAVDPSNQKAFAARPRQGRRDERLMFEDARQQALEARRLGASGWRVEALLALCAWHLGEKRAAFEHAITAMETMPAHPESWTAVATLALFAQARVDAIWQALRDKTDWPREWMTDVNAAYSVLARHPLGTDQHAVTHYDFLDSLGAKGRAARILQEGLERFPDSWELHDRLRARAVAERGAKGLEETYDTMLQQDGASQNLSWFAGLASIVAAEFYRRGNDLGAADAAYDRALARYDQARGSNPESGVSCDHYSALALAGKSRIAMERGDLDAALDLLVAGIGRHPEATDDLDGLSISPAMTANALRARLVEAKREPQVARLDQVLGDLDPILLEVPEFERAAPTPPSGRRGRRNR